MAEDQTHWLPVRAAVRPGGLYLFLRDIAPDQLSDAFMFETLARVKAPEALVSLSPEEVAAAAPAGMIFHVGRSGSTVMSQLLKQHGGALVYSEPQAVNELIIPPARWPRGEIVAGLRLLGAAFGRHARGPYVLKLSSWNTLLCDLLVEAFPETPWAFNVRDPLEVAVSLQRIEPGWFNDDQASSRALRKLIDADAVSQSKEEFIARVFAASCEAVARLPRARGVLIDHGMLPAATWVVLAAHFALPTDAAALARMQAQAGGYSKAKIGAASAFAPDGAEKQQAASPLLRAAMDATARPALARLKALYE